MAGCPAAKNNRKNRQDDKSRKELLARLHKEYQDARLEIFVALIPRIEQEHVDFQLHADSIAAYASHSMTGEDSAAVGALLKPEHKAYADSLASHFMADSHIRSVAVRGAHALSKHKVAEALASDDAEFRARAGREIVALMKKPLEHGTGPRDQYLATEAKATRSSEITPKPTTRPPTRSRSTSTTQMRGARWATPSSAWENRKKRSTAIKK